MMEWLSQHWASIADYAVAFGAITGTVLGLYNAVKLHCREKLILEVSLQASNENGNPTIRVVNHSIFQVSISDVGVLTDDAQYYSVDYINDFCHQHALPYKIGPKEEISFELDTNWAYLKNRSMYRTYVNASTGESFIGKDTMRSWIKSNYSVGIARFRLMFKRNEFLDI